MKSRYSILFFFVFSMLLFACGAETPSTPTATPALEPASTPTATIAPLPTFTPTVTATPVPPPPTFGPPAVIESFYVKKAKCVVIKPATGNPAYRVEIWFRLAWQDKSENEDGFWLYRDGNRVAELPANTTEYLDTFELVKGGRISTYFVVAYNSAGETKSELMSFPNPC